MVVGTTHLYWHPHYEYVKLHQTKFVLDQMNAFCKKMFLMNNKKVVKQTPCILCVDLNSKPNSIVYEFITRGVVDGWRVAPWRMMEELEDLERDGEVIRKQEGICRKKMTKHCRKIILYL
uniref:Uncharacterized protein n=1 Tax=Ditylum brightwellii TaxID=49249 RepID=A0A7S1YQ86_9STRA|mmetsp:Transcript_13411/g.20001  ORF Transcript_13411/g.20001 Transcript_13411/m.20001 type:complete len:120 (+) Transcript_13411:204-563(+)